jgi:succinoglycan biosynthesis protein ExoM
MRNREIRDQVVGASESSINAPEGASDRTCQTQSQPLANVQVAESTALGADALLSLAPSSAACFPDLDPAVVTKVALCICTCKRPVGLTRLLEAVAELDFEGHLSVVVVDNDAAAAEGLKVCQGVAPTYRWPLACAVEERRGIPFARNRATALALEQNPDFIAVLDDDERPCRDWLRELLHVQAETGADAVGGPVLPEFAPSAPSWLIDGGFFERSSHPDQAKIGLSSIGNLIAKASCFRAFMPEPFDTRFALTGSEGGIFLRRLAARNYTMRWAAHAHAFEILPPSRANLRWLMRRRFRTGVNSILQKRIFDPGARRELQHILLTIRLLVAGLTYLIIHWRNRTQRTQGMLTMCRALGRAAGHLGVRYSEYRTIHGL